MPRLLYMALLVAGVLALLPSCLELRDTPRRQEGECVRCHGDGTRLADPALQSAPPFDLAGNHDVRYPGVGAHRQHLEPGRTHAGLSCDECHRVPDRVDAPGHLDAEMPAEVVFGELSTTADARPHYDVEARTCADTHCHGARSPVWTRPRSSQQACGSCHGLPPAVPHPQAADCALCHGEVVDARGRFVAPEKHVDGRVQVQQVSCGACHGSENNPAPPRALSGATQASAPGVGAHQVHLAGGQSSRAVACDECHAVPDELYAPGHLDGSGVDLLFSGVGQGTEWQPSRGTCVGGACHGNGESPAWSEPQTLPCSGCHGDPPAAPHPASSRCDVCHSAVVETNGTITQRELHVDGVVQVSTADDCTACHGSASGNALGAPPEDTRGNTEAEAPGVGAHTAHLVGRGLARTLTCDECHDVPSVVDSPGHIDSQLPAEVQLRGIAAAYGAEPRYEQGRCADTYCHGDDFIFSSQASGGGYTVPDWTRVDGVQVTCDGCHGMPPPAPHPAPADDCSECHRNASGRNGFTHPELHVDGKLTFFLDREDALEQLLED